MADLFAGPACEALASMWNDVVVQFLSGGPAVPARLKDWGMAYNGKGARGEVEFEALPEPFLGKLARPVMVFLALNPGRADLRFQGRNSIFADEIRAAGSYSAWAASWPYLRDPWTATKGSNRHHTSRLRFAQDWSGRPNLPAEDMVGFELYPWHSAAVTAPIRPNPSVVEEFVWRPVAELKAPVFAFGAPWLSILSNSLGLEIVDRLGAGGRAYGSSVASRRVTVFRAKSDALTIMAEQHSGAAGPPSSGETALLREAVEQWLRPPWPDRRESDATTHSRDIH